MACRRERIKNKHKRHGIDFLYKYTRNACTKDEFGKMLSIKALKPSQREKKRYIVYEVSGLEKENMFSIQNKVVKKLIEMLGIYDSASAGIQALKYNQEKRRAIIRVNNKMTTKVKGCFTLINEIEKQKINIKSIGVSGSMKKAKEEYLEIKETKNKKNIQINQN